VAAALAKALLGTDEIFVTTTRTCELAEIEAGLDGHRYRGNLDTRHGWRSATARVAAMWRMQHEGPAGHVVATGSSNSVKDVAHIAFENAGIESEKHSKCEGAICALLETSNAHVGISVDGPFGPRPPEAS
jgi:GDP-D-mannose dehydratase